MVNNRHEEKPRGMWPRGEVGKDSLKGDVVTIWYDKQQVVTYWEGEVSGSDTDFSRKAPPSKESDEQGHLQEQAGLTG